LRFSALVFMDQPTGIVSARHRSKKWSGIFYWLVAALFSLAAALFISSIWAAALAEMEIVAATEFASVSIPVKLAAARVKPPRQTAKGLYLTAYSAGNPKKMEEIIKLIGETELNAVVIDIKDYTGYVLYDSHAPLVKKFKTEKILIRNLSALIRRLHEHKIYVIARQTVFQDPALAEKKPEWAFADRGGGVWRDKKGLSWVDATRPEVWAYNLAIAREAIGLGFDEINFDYVRFPSDGDLSRAVYRNGASKRYEVMGKFYSYLSEKLADEPAWISVDMFGLVMERKGEDDMNIGQRLIDAVNVVDYVSPMLYPSHYPVGHLGLTNPADNPGLVIAHDMEEGIPRFTGTRAEVRPWIQAFNLGAVYDGAKIREEIDAVEKYSSAGWMLWNASNRYSDAGLDPAE